MTRDSSGSGRIDHQPLGMEPAGTSARLRVLAHVSRAFAKVVTDYRRLVETIVPDRQRLEVHGEAPNVDHASASLPDPHESMEWKSIDDGEGGLIRLAMSKAGWIVVIGASSGGMQALKELAAQLPATFSAPVFVAQHMAADADAAVLARVLDNAGTLSCAVAQNNERFRVGRIYVAPADNHLLIKPAKMIVTKGARENRYRPAADPLFRSAAISHGPRVISVVLTGNLDDGTEGTAAVKRCGGITVVQDPGDAAYPDMPRSALATKVDHCVPLRELGVLLDRLVRTKPGKRKPIPEDIRIEAIIAERVLSDVKAVDTLGDQVPYNCPNCGGVLWEIEKTKTLRYRCHTGHSFTAATLLAEQSGKIEETLWITLRMLEERRNLLRSMRERGQSTKSAIERERDTEMHIERIRAILIAGGRTSNSSVLRPHAA